MQCLTVLLVRDSVLAFLVTAIIILILPYWHSSVDIIASLFFIDGKTFTVLYVVSVVITFLREIFMIKTGL